MLLFLYCYRSYDFTIKLHLDCAKRHVHQLRADHANNSRDLRGQVRTDFLFWNFDRENRAEKVSLAWVLLRRHLLDGLVWADAEGSGY